MAKSIATPPQKLEEAEPNSPGDSVLEHHDAAASGLGQIGENLPETFIQ